MNSNVPESLAKRMRMINVIAAGAILLAVAGTSLGGILPLYARMSRNDQEAVRLRTELAKLDGLQKTLKEVGAELDKTQERLAAAETRLPRIVAMDEFMEQLAKAADEAGLEVDAVTPKEIQDGGNYRVMPVEIRGTGTFDKCYAFLTGLRKMNRLTRLDSLVLQLNEAAPTRDAAAPPLCRVSIGISTFVAR